MAVTMPKRKSKKKKDTSVEQEERANKLAEVLADKVYGEPAEDPNFDEPVKKSTPEKKTSNPRYRASLSLDHNLYMKAEDLAFANKRKKIGPKSISAIYDAAIAEYFKK